MSSTRGKAAKRVATAAKRIKATERETSEAPGSRFFSAMTRPQEEDFQTYRDRPGLVAKELGLSSLSAG